MELTVAYLQNQFKKYNAMFFNNELPWILIKIGRSKSNFGIYHSETSLVTGKVLKQHIMISKYYNQTDKQYDETLIHEMIHYYIKFKGIKDNNSHGYEFIKLMNKINSISDFNITIKGSSFGLTSDIENNKVYRIMKFVYNGNIYFAKVSNKFNIRSYSNIIKDVKFYRTKDNYFSNWRTCCSRIHYRSITHEQLAKLTLQLAA
jgi:hypothetical protein